MCAHPPACRIKGSTVCPHRYKSKCVHGIVMLTCQPRELSIRNNRMTVSESVGTAVKDVCLWQIKSTKGSSSKPRPSGNRCVFSMHGMRDTPGAWKHHGVEDLLIPPSLFDWKRLLLNGHSRVTTIKWSSDMKLLLLLWSPYATLVNKAPVLWYAQYTMEQPRLTNAQKETLQSLWLDPKRLDSLTVNLRTPPSHNTTIRENVPVFVRINGN